MRALTFKLTSATCVGEDTCIIWGPGTSHLQGDVEVDDDGAPLPYYCEDVEEIAEESPPW